MRRLVPTRLLAAAALLAAGCGNQAALPPAPAAGGVRAIEADRALTDEDAGTPDNNPGTWGGVQAPNISDAPRLRLPGMPR
jgi:hypothetical protein